MWKHCTWCLYLLIALVPLSKYMLRYLVSQGNHQCTNTHIQFYGINIKHICECSNIVKCAMCIVYQGTPQSNKQTQFQLRWHLNFQWARVSLMVLSMFNVYICRNVVLILHDVLPFPPHPHLEVESFHCKQPTMPYNKVSKLITFCRNRRYDRHILFLRFD